MDVNPILYKLCDGLFQVLSIELQRFSITMSIMDNNQHLIAETVELDNELSRDAEKSIRYHTNYRSISSS